MRKLKINNPIDFADDLKEAGIPFTLTSTSFTKIIIVSEEETYYYSEKGKLRMVELNLIKQVKNYCEGLNLRIKVNRDFISYIKVNNFNNAIYKRDIWEVDLTAAYWNLAFKYRFINKGIYLKGLNMDDDGNLIKPIKNKYGNVYNHVSKMARLIALGNLAKIKTHFYFDGFKYMVPRSERSDKTENIFFKVSMETDSIMKMLSMIAGDDYLFYWVDAIYVKSERALNLVCDYITNEVGMNFKITKIYKLLKTSSYVMVWDENNLNQNGDMMPRPYIFKPVKGKKIRQVLDLNNNLILREDLDNFLNTK